MGTQRIDNRGLQAPEPMVRILARLPGLNEGDELEVLMDREPRLLYPELERRGFAWDFGPRDGDLVLTVRKAAE
jgi:tRNA 2-thiouridine synthesizing protein A